LLAGIGVPQPFGSRAARQMSLKANQYCVADVTKLRDSRFNFEKKSRLLQVSRAGAET
jgi:hypothetical protein